MSVWLTPQQIAAMRLDGMPTTERGIRKMAEKNLLSTRTRGRGKGIEIALSSLPPAAQRDYYARLERPVQALIADPSKRNAAMQQNTINSQPSPAGEHAGEGPGEPLVSSPGATPGLSAVRGAAPAAESFCGGDVEDDTDAVLVGQLIGSRRPTEGDFERVRRARRLLIALRPLIDLPPRHRGRRAMAERIGQSLGLSFQQVYRLAERARDGGLLALARLGLRADRGLARVVVSDPWQLWAARAEQAGAGTVADLAGVLLQAVRAAWVAGAPSARQAWLKASAAVGQQLHQAGLPSELVAALLGLPCPRRFVEAEGAQYRVAGRARRDAKGVYDHHLAPVRRTAAGLAPGELVCGDISPLDIPVARPDGSTAYARMISWHDVATNWLWVDLYLVDKGEGVRREHVAASFARLCEQAPFGAPARLYLDNGSEYKWEDMLFAWAQLAELTGQRFRVDEAALLPESGRVVRSIPFHPRGKRIEGQFGNLHHWLSWWFGYVGGNRMAKRIANLGRAPVVSEFFAVRDWLAATLADYHVTPQPGAEHMGGLSPQQRIDHFLVSGWRPMRIDRTALMLAFSDRDERRVDRGAINYRGRTWFGDFLMGLTGRVQVAYPRIAAPEFEALIVLDLQGRLLGVASPERVFGLLDGEGAKEAGRRRQAFRLLMGDKAAEANQGGELDEAKLAGFRAQMLGLDATLARAEAAAERVEPVGELADMARRYAEARAQFSDAMRAALARAEAAKAAESLARLAFEDEDTRAARALGF